MNANQAKQNLSNYLKALHQAVGLPWGVSQDQDVAAIVDSIIEEASMDRYRRAEKMLTEPFSYSWASTWGRDVKGPDDV